MNLKKTTGPAWRQRSGSRRLPQQQRSFRRRRPQERGGSGGNFGGAGAAELQLYEVLKGNPGQKTKKNG